MQEMIIEVLEIVLRLIVMAALGYAVGWIRSKIGETNYARFYAVATATVEAIEQEFGKSPGQWKKDKAHSFLKKKFGHMFDDSDINQLIESLVFEMNKQLKPVVKE